MKGLKTTFLFRKGRTIPSAFHYEFVATHVPYRVNIIVESQLEQLSAVSDRVDILTTNHTKLQPGLLLFLLFCPCFIAFAGLAARRK